MFGPDRCGYLFAQRRKYKPSLLADANTFTDMEPTVTATAESINDRVA